MPKQHPHIGQFQHGNNQDQRGLTSSITELQQRGLPVLQEDHISQLLSDASKKTGYAPVGDSSNPTYVPDPVASMIEISMGDKVQMPMDASNTLADMFFSQKELRLAVAQASTYLSAGCALAVIPDEFKSSEEATPQVIYARHTFATVAPLVLQSVPEGDELTPADSPVQFYPFKFAEVSSEGLQFKIGRRQAKDTPVLQLHGMIYKALVEAIAHKIDEAIAAKIAASTPTAFTLAKAAAAKVKTAEIKAVTDGTSTKAVMNEGNLYLDGFAAELSSAPGNHLIVPRYWAVAMPELLRLLVERDSTGGYIFTMWTNIEALSTSQSLAWTA